MQIELQARGFDLTPSLRDHIARRLAQTLEHIRDDIKKVVVRISDDNGPRHGIDKRCMVRVALRGRKDVVVQDISGDMYRRSPDRGNRLIPQFVHPSIQGD
jgi:ribosome-associated translation inhibitor RaiA